MENKQEFLKKQIEEISDLLSTLPEDSVELSLLFKLYQKRVGNLALFTKDVYIKQVRDKIRYITINQYENNEYTLQKVTDFIEDLYKVCAEKEKQYCYIWTYELDPQKFYEVELEIENGYIGYYAHTTGTKKCYIVLARLAKIMRWLDNKYNQLQRGYSIPIKKKSKQNKEYVKDDKKSLYYDIRNELISKELVTQKDDKYKWNADKTQFCYFCYALNVNGFFEQIPWKRITSEYGLKNNLSGLLCSMKKYEKISDEKKIKIDEIFKKFGLISSFPKIK